MAEGGGRSYTTAQRVGLFVGLGLGGGLVVASPFLTPPEGLDASAIRLLGVAVVVAVWWVTEALPLGATALLPAAAFPLLGILSAHETSPAYFSPIILLLLGGFLLALAVERSGVHRRLALHVLLAVGTSPRRLVLGFAVAAGVMSMWISNTATTLVMMPVALAIADRASRPEIPEGDARAFALAILLGTGYGASVGGMGTPVGTPPNLIAIRVLGEAPSEGGFTFVTWMLASLPAVVILIPLVWYVLTRLFPKVPDTLPLGAAEVLRADLAALGPWRRSEVASLAVFGLAAVLWVTRPDLPLGEGLVIEGWASRLGLEGTHDGAVAVAVALLAFALPSGEGDGERLLPWKTALDVPWGLVLLFGGGIALSKGFDATGLSAWLGGVLAEVAGSSLTAFVALASLGGTFGTEVMSNTALANILMPILASTAEQAAIDPRALVWPVALACSCAFMMPAATGPNAIVFGTGRIRIIEMVRAGFLTNWLAWAVIVMAAIFRFAVLRGG
jgi:sodium-dependent dicarboxylate transporter 2/3/5